MVLHEYKLWVWLLIIIGVVKYDRTPQLDWEVDLMLQNCNCLTIFYTTPLNISGVIGPFLLILVRIELCSHI